MRGRGRGSRARSCAKRFQGMSRRYERRFSQYPRLLRAHSLRFQGISRVSRRSPLAPVRAFPRQAPSGRGSPASGGTMHALRLPSERHRHFVCLHARLIPRALHRLCLRMADSRRCGAHHRRAWPLVTRLGLPGTRTGTQTALPGLRGPPRAFAMLWFPAGRACPCPTADMPGRSPYWERESYPVRRSFRGCIHTASAPAAYASRLDYSARARLASGCRAGSTGRDSAVACTRRAPLANFSCSSLVSDNLLPRRTYPGATLSDPGSPSAPIPDCKNGG